MPRMKKFLKNILNFLLPPRCVCCGKILESEDDLCPDCFRQVNFISEPYCRRCGMPFADMTGANADMLCPNCVKNKKNFFRFKRSAVKYDDFSKKMILAFKFMDKTENVKIFAKWLKVAGNDIFAAGADILVPVPLHYSRLVKRRYNQSALLVLELSKLTGLTADLTSLVKFKSTKPQVHFSGQERVKNVKGVFKVKTPAKIKGKRIILIDDVLTTGSTVRECSKVLLAAGAASVDVLTVARVCRD